MTNKQHELKLGKATLFLKTRLKRLPQEDETWEADFRALPKPVMQSETHYLGMVVLKRNGATLIDTSIEHSPSVNDVAMLLAEAMRRPLIGSAHRPRRLHVRNHPQWAELFRHLAEFGIDVSVRGKLPKLEKAYQDYLRQMRKAHCEAKAKPTKAQTAVEDLFPAIAKWVQGYGHIEIGDQEAFGFVARALDYGGLVFEDDKPDTLTEALAALRKRACPLV